MKEIQSMKDNSGLESSEEFTGSRFVGALKLEPLPWAGRSGRASLEEWHVQQYGCWSETHPPQ